MGQPEQDSRRSDSIHWDAPPPYEAMFGDEECSVSIVVQDNGRISMQFLGNNSLLTPIYVPENIPEDRPKPIK